jgi:hypothetical protein
MDAAAAAGEVDVIAGTTSDGLIAKYRWARMELDQGAKAATPVRMTRT